MKLRSCLFKIVIITGQKPYQGFFQLSQISFLFCAGYENKYVDGSSTNLDEVKIVKELFLRHFQSL